MAADRSAEVMMMAVVSMSCVLTISTVHGPMRVGLQLVEDEDERSFQFSHLRFVDFSQLNVATKAQRLPAQSAKAGCRVAW